MSSASLYTPRGAVQTPQGGLLRTPARPRGWLAPGPAPLPEAQWPAASLPRAGEDLCFLTGDWRILQRLDGHRYSLDDLMTAWFAARAVAGRAVQRHLDLGCGIGSVLMMTAWRVPTAISTGVEAQDVSVDLARRSLEINGITDRCQVVHSDLRSVDVRERGPFDLITGTPPYIPIGDGVISSAVQKGPCRHEFRGGVEDYCAAAARHLPPAGRFVACQAAADVARVEQGAAAAGLVVLERLDVIARAGRPALFSLYAMARQDAPDLPPEVGVVLPPFLVRTADGQRTPACEAMRQDMGLPPSAVSAAGTSAPA